MISKSRIKAYAHTAPKNEMQSEFQGGEGEELEDEIIDDDQPDQSPCPLVLFSLQDLLTIAERKEEVAENCDSDPENMKDKSDESI